ncbi:MAG TPA: hypothetical protein VGM69_16260 [Chloroflexota bacterium]
MLKWFFLAALGAAGYFAYRRWSGQDNSYTDTAREWVGEARDRVADAARDASSYAGDQASRARDALSA